MSNIDKRSYRADGGDIGAGRLKEIADNVYGDEEKNWLAKRVLALLDDNAKLLREKDAMEAAALALRDDMRLAREKLGAAEKRNAEQADIIAKQEKWIKDVEATMISATDRAEAAEKRIAEQRETLLAARSYVMQFVHWGDAHSNGVLQAIDRAAGKGE